MPGAPGPQIYARAGNIAAWPPFNLIHSAMGYVYLELGMKSDTQERGKESHMLYFFAPFGHRRAQTGHARSNLLQGDIDPAHHTCTVTAAS